MRGELHDPVGEREQALVVRGDDDDPAGAGDLAEQREHALDLDVVEVRGRLVGEHERRVVCQRPRDGDALLLSARQVGRAVVETVAEVDPLEQLVGTPARLRRGCSRPPAAAPRRSRGPSGSGRG